MGFRASSGRLTVDAEITSFRSRRGYGRTRKWQIARGMLLWLGITCGGLWSFSGGVYPPILWEQSPALLRFTAAARR
jgi:hypothetical protein